MMRLLLHTDAPDLAMSVLKERHPDLAPEVCTSYDGLAAAIAEARPSVVYSSRFLPGAFPSRALMETPCVRWVSNAGSGVNHLIPWDSEQVTVTNSAGVAAEAMAQFAFGAMLHFSLDVPGLLYDQSNRAWANRSIVPLSGKRLLLVGFGKTCQAAARLGKAMGMDVCAIRANPQAVDDLCEVGPPQDLAHQMTIADFILVCLPLTDRTIGLVGAEALAKIKKGAVLVDLSRGGIVDHDSLVDALDDRRIGGAALDVFPTEPLSAESPLWDRPDVLISPHCSGVYDGWEQRAVEMFADNLDRWRSGAPLENVVDPVKGY